MPPSEDSHRVTLSTLLLAREAALWFYEYHMATLDKAPTEWVVRQDAAPFWKYLQTHPLP